MNKPPDVCEENKQKLIDWFERNYQFLSYRRESRNQCWRLGNGRNFRLRMWDNGKAGFFSDMTKPISLSREETSSILNFMESSQRDFSMLENKFLREAQDEDSRL